MKKLLIFIISIGVLAGVHVASSAPTSTRVQNLFISDRASTGFILGINSAGLVVTSTDQTGAGSNGTVTTSTPFTVGNIVVASGDGIINTTSSVFYLASNPSGYITTSTNNFGGLTNTSITATSPITWSVGSVIACPTCLTTSTGLSSTNFATTSVEQWANNGLYLTTSTGLGVVNFTSPNVSQWTNNSGYLTTVDISANTNLTGGLGLTLTGDDMACDTASGSVFGCLASADWTTFNNKQNAITAGNYLTLTGATIDTDSEIASSSIAFNIYDATSTAPYRYSKWRTEIARTITEISCNEYATATSTIEIYRATSIATTTNSQTILASILCGLSGTTSNTFTTSSLNAGDVLIVNVSTTTGTPTWTALNVYLRKND